MSAKYEKIRKKIGQITTQKLKFSIKNFFSKCDQIHSFMRIWSHLLKKFLMENFIFCALYCTRNRAITNAYQPSYCVFLSQNISKLMVNFY